VPRLLRPCFVRRRPAAGHPESEQKAQASWHRQARGRRRGRPRFPRRTRRSHGHSGPGRSIAGVPECRRRVLIRASACRPLPAPGRYTARRSRPPRPS